MRTLFFLLCIFFLSCNQKPADSSGDPTAAKEETPASVASTNIENRYGIKSAIIIKKETNSMMKGDKTITTWFDNYGAIEVNESYSNLEMMGQKIEETTWSLLQDGMLYSYKIGEKTSTKFDVSKTFDSKNIDWSKMNEELKKQFGIKDDGTQEFLGLTCNAFTMDNPQMSAKGSYLIWQNIVLKTETQMPGISLSQVVTSIDDNASIPASKLTLPKDVEFREFTMPGK